MHPLSGEQPYIYFPFAGKCLIIQVILSLMLILLNGGIIINLAIRGPA